MTHRSGIKTVSAMGDLAASIRKRYRTCGVSLHGGVAEWLKAPVLKSENAGVALQRIAEIRIRLPGFLLRETKPKL
jgi:hypothetical protein